MRWYPPLLSRPLLPTAMPRSPGRFSVEEAADLALVLRSGALPVELVELETRSVGPTLGQDSWNRGLKAGLLGMGLVMLFMLGYYRFLGLWQISPYFSISSWFWKCFPGSTPP
jgi:preprotein translocase subunit SecD